MKGRGTMNKQKHEQHEHIDELVIRFQNGDEDAGEEILRLFGCHPAEEMSAYVGKFYKMIRYGRFSFKDRDSRRFIAVFIADPEIRQQLIPFYQGADAKVEVKKAVDNLTKMCKILEDEDLQQDLRMLLLQQAKRWKKTSKNIYFTGYLYNSYRFAVKNHIKSLFKSHEPFMHKPYQMDPVCEELIMDTTSDINLDQIVFEDTPILELDDELGNSWVRGLTCGEEFLDCTPLQRLILRLHYHEGYSDPKIANMTNLHINTIFKQRTKANKIVQATVQRLLDEGYDE